MRKRRLDGTRPRSLHSSWVCLRLSGVEQCVHENAMKNPGLNCPLRKEQIKNLLKSHPRVIRPVTQSNRSSLSRIKAYRRRVLFIIGQAEWTSNSAGQMRTPDFPGAPRLRGSLHRAVQRSGTGEAGRSCLERATGSGRFSAQCVRDGFVAPFR